MGYFQENQSFLFFVFFLKEILVYLLQKHKGKSEHFSFIILQHGHNFSLKKKGKQV